jgi:hypothetical protein
MFLGELLFPHFDILAARARLSWLTRCRINLDGHLPIVSWATGWVVASSFQRLVPRHGGLELVHGICPARYSAIQVEDGCLSFVVDPLMAGLPATMGHTLIVLIHLICPR